MSVGRAAPWLLLGGLIPLACGERAGDAVIALPAEDASPGGAPGFPDAPGGAAGEPASSVNEEGTVRGPGGLCALCTTSRECGDANDACIVHGDELFCGRYCVRSDDCPDGYTCVDLSNSQLRQCVPNGSCVAPTALAPALGDVRSYVLERINAARAEQARLPLDESDCLNDIAQESAVGFAWADAPFGKFLDECQPIWPSCECGWRAEAELTIARWGLDWQTAVDGALDGREEATEVFASAYLSPSVSDVGIGFWLSGDEAWIALSFR